jgi:stage V sporulation protein SpoVS
MHTAETLVRVGVKSRPSAMAGAIAGMIREGKTVALQAIGAGAVNQAVKAVATARSYQGGPNRLLLYTFILHSETEQQRPNSRQTPAHPSQ